MWLCSQMKCPEFFRTFAFYEAALRRGRPDHTLVDTADPGDSSKWILSRTASHLLALRTLQVVQFVISDRSFRLNEFWFSSRSWVFREPNSKWLLSFVRHQDRH